MNRIYADRVTVIHGETGCGKSSGLPVMLLDEAEKRGEPCFMMVSQPRRIAAASLAERLRATHGQNRTAWAMASRRRWRGRRVVFVTTGYQCGCWPITLSTSGKHTHLIIDEVHERSVDGDVLCMLARRLLHRYPHIKLILMSATIHTLYTDYFSEANDGINRLPGVPARRRQEVSYRHIPPGRHASPQAARRASLHPRPWMRPRS